MTKGKKVKPSKAEVQFTPHKVSNKHGKKFKASPYVVSTAGSGSGSGSGSRGDGGGASGGKGKHFKKRYRDE